MEIYENPPNQYLCKINKKTKRKNRITWKIVQSQEERHKSKSSASNVDFKHISVYLEYFLLCLVCKLPLQLMLCLKKFEKTYPYFLARLIIRTQSKEIYKNIILIFVTSRNCSEQLLLSLNCGNDKSFSPNYGSGVSLPIQHPLCLRACMDSKKTKIFKNSSFRDITPSTETPRFRKWIYIPVILYLHLVLNTLIGYPNFKLKTGKAGLYNYINRSWCSN